MGAWERDSERRVGVVTGCLLLASRKTWDELEGFDERFFMYGEDGDLAFRARHKGLRPMITPHAEIVHFVGAASPTSSKRKQVFRAKVAIARSHLSHPRIAVACLVAGVGLRAAVHSLLSRLGGQRGDASWLDLWRDRSAWLVGYPPVDR
jgi:GT2 family glycosyltransferase